MMLCGRGRAGATRQDRGQQRRRRQRPEPTPALSSRLTSIHHFHIPADLVKRWFSNKKASTTHERIMTRFSSFPGFTCD
jgi:hypothetical protein